MAPRRDGSDFPARFFWRPYLFSLKPMRAREWECFSGRAASCSTPAPRGAVRRIGSICSHETKNTHSPASRNRARVLPLRRLRLAIVRRGCPSELRKRQVRPRLPPPQPSSLPRIVAWFVVSLGITLHARDGSTGRRAGARPFLGACRPLYCPP